MSRADLEVRSRRQGGFHSRVLRFGFGGFGV